MRVAAASSRGALSRREFQALERSRVKRRNERSRINVTEERKRKRQSACTVAQTSDCYGSHFHARHTGRGSKPRGSSDLRMRPRRRQSSLLIAEYRRFFMAKCAELYLVEDNFVPSYCHQVGAKKLIFLLLNSFSHEILVESFLF